VSARNGNLVRLGVPEDHSSLENAPEFDYSSFYATTGTGNTGCLVAHEGLLAKVRTLIHEEISLITVLYFPIPSCGIFRVVGGDLAPSLRFIEDNSEYQSEARKAKSASSALYRRTEEVAGAIRSSARSFMARSAST
jgi:hypothetical protein